MSYSSLSVGTVRWGASCINFVVLVAEKPLVVFVCDADARIEIDRPAPVVFIHPSVYTAAMASFGNGTVWSPLISTVQCNRQGHSRHRLSASLSNSSDTRQRHFYLDKIFVKCCTHKKHSVKKYRQSMVDPRFIKSLS